MTFLMKHFHKEVAKSTRGNIQFVLFAYAVVAILITHGPARRWLASFMPNWAAHLVVMTTYLSVIMIIHTPKNVLGRLWLQGLLAWNLPLFYTAGKKVAPWEVILLVPCALYYYAVYFWRATRTPRS